MTDKEFVPDLNLEGPGAIPRSNGEVVFQSPWESRAFALALALVEQDLFTLSDFQAELIVAIAEWEALGRSTVDYLYYECWLIALERLVSRRTAVGIDDIDLRSTEFLAREPGHDHGHDHSHEH